MVCQTSWQEQLWWSDHWGSWGLGHSHLCQRAHGKWVGYNLYVGGFKVDLTLTQIGQQIA